MVTSGAAGAMAAATAACIAGSDPARESGNSPTPPASSTKSSCMAAAAHSIAPFGWPAESWCWRAAEDDVRAAIGENTAMIYTTALGSTLEKLIAIAKDDQDATAAGRCRRHPAARQSEALRQDGRRPLLLQRRQGPVRAAMLGPAAGAQGPDRSGHAQHQPVGRRRVPRHEGRQRGDHGMSGGGRSLDEDGSQRPQPPVERARRAHSEAGRYGSRRQDRNPRFPKKATAIRP